MAGVATEDSGAGGLCGSDQSGPQQLRCQAGEALAEWRSSEQVESGTPSTSPPYWDSDDEDDEGPRPSELYGKYTWKIEKFSQVNKRELRSSVFEVGSYKWYILIYPQGCDVCNHLSLFLCVSNHDKLLPGWSHLAQFTISVVHKDPKKSKYSDTLHRFWKKEHDWGWKKFIELPKVFDGFVDNDSLVIKAQVQIIRERVDRPFRCLDCVYRRELIRVYLSNVQDKCRKFIEEKIKDLRKRIEDKARWTSLRAFWLEMDKSSRRLMSQGKAEPILKALVLQFFEHKEVVSTLIMDSLYSGMKAIDNPEKGKSKGTYPQGEEPPAPVICRENDTFVLVDDMLLLLARAALEPLPVKDEKSPQIPQNRTKEGASGEEFGKDSIERDERRLTELGRKTIEIFVFDHIFRKMDVALQEALSLKMQEELIREEEAACLADKEKKSKKKQSKQKKNHRKGKDKGRDEKRDRAVKESIAVQTEMVHEKVEAVEDLSDVSDSVDCVPEDSKGRDVAPVDSDTNVSEVVDGIEAVSLSAVDDSSSSTCSSDSLPPTVRSAPEQVNSRSPHGEQRTPSQGRNHQSGAACDTGDWVREEATQSSEVVPDVENFKAVEHPFSKASFRSSEDRTAYRAENYVGNKDGVAGYRYRTSGSKDGSAEFSRNGKNSITQSYSSPTKSIPSKITPPKVNSATNPGVLKNSSAFAYKQVDRSILATNITLSNPEAQKFNGPKPSDRSNSTNNAVAASPKPEAQRITTPKPSGPVDNPSGPVKIEKPTGNPSGLVKTEKPSLPVMSRPLSAPLVVQASKPAISSGSVGQRATPTLSRSVSATGRLGPEQSSLPSAATPSYVPLSYRNAILGSSNIATGTSSTNNTHISQNHSTSSSVINASAPPFLPRRATQPDSNSKFSFGVMNQQDMFTQSLLNDMQPFNLWSPVQNGGPQNLQVPAGTSGRQIGEDFQHLDIINDLLDDDFTATDLGPTSNIGYQNIFRDGPHDHLNRQFSFPGDSGMLVRSMSSCGFEGSRIYHDNEFQNGYISDMILPEASPGPYMNGQLDGLIPNQWQMDSSELLYPGMGTMDLDGYPYHHLIAEEYRNPSHTIGANGYPVFRSTNGI